MASFEKVNTQNIFRLVTILIYTFMFNLLLVMLEDMNLYVKLKLL